MYSVGAVLRLRVLDCLEGGGTSSGRTGDCTVQCVGELWRGEIGESLCSALRTSTPVTFSSPSPAIGCETLCSAVGGHHFYP